MNNIDMTDIEANQHDSFNNITIRKMNFDFEVDIPKYYLNGNIYRSHFFNGLNLLFPEGERFFMKAVRDNLSKINNEQLKQQAKSFFGQEAQHALEHEKFFDVLETHNYQFRKRLNSLEKFIHFSKKRLPLGLRISLTAGAEHLTATLGALSLVDQDIANAHPVMRDLIHWHAIEEIEHKAVAYDVLQACYPNYILRCTGYVIAAIFIGISSSSLTSMFLKQDNYKRKEIRKMRKSEFSHLLKKHPKLVKSLLSYFERNFHPNQVNESSLVNKHKKHMKLA